MTLTNLLLTIYRFILLCPDQNKKTYVDFKLKDTLKLILFKGNVIEKKFCIKLLGKIECNEASTEEGELFRLIVPLLKLYTAKQSLAVVSEGIHNIRL